MDEAPLIRLYGWSYRMGMVCGVPKPLIKATLKPQKSAFWLADKFTRKYSGREIPLPS